MYRMVRASHGGVAHGPWRWSASSLAADSCSALAQNATCRTLVPTKRRRAHAMTGPRRNKARDPRQSRPRRRRMAHRSHYDGARSWCGHRPWPDGQEKTDGSSHIREDDGCRRSRFALSKPCKCAARAKGPECRSCARAFCRRVVLVAGDRAAPGERSPGHVGAEPVDDATRGGGSNPARARSAGRSDRTGRAFIWRHDRHRSRRGSQGFGRRLRRRARPTRAKTTPPWPSSIRHRRLPPALFGPAIMDS
jgi:hypothetical protein